MGLNKLKPNVLVTGATGFLGRCLVACLAAEGASVRALCRSFPPPGTFPDRVGMLAGDIADEGVVRGALNGVDTVYHLAARLHIPDPAPSTRSEYHRVNVGGTRVLLGCCRKAGVRRVVLFSTIAVYGSTSRKVIDEDTPPNPDTWYAESKLQAEQEALAAIREDGQPLACVLRLAAVYGPGMKGNYSRMVSGLARGWFPPVGDGSNRRTLLYKQDAAAAALLAASHPKAAGRLFNVSDGAVHSMQDILRQICEALGRRPPRFSIPERLARLAAGWIEDAFAFTGRRPPLGRFTVDKYTEDLAVRSQRIQRELGFAPRWDLVSGWRETIRQMRLEGSI